MISVLKIYSTPWSYLYSTVHKQRADAVFDAVTMQKLWQNRQVLGMQNRLP